MIDLRSDTFTLPTEGMLQAMSTARVGDDVFGEDPTVNELQAHVAGLFGKEAALFFPSGTMANQVAIRAHTRPGDELICDAGAHVHYYEGGGIAANSGVSVNLVNGDRGVFTADDVRVRVREDNVHFPVSRLVCVENTCNRGGGRVFPIEQMVAIAEVCRTNGLALHMDGARLFNAMRVDGTQPEDHGRLFDSISICLSKGLGAPVGSVLVGGADFIHRARRIRKLMGGGMRQAGFLAAAGLYALHHHVERLDEDHRHAALLHATLSELSFISRVLPQQTNIVTCEMAEGQDAGRFLRHLMAKEVLAMPMGPSMIRFVTHLGINSADVDRAMVAINAYNS